MQRRRDLVYKVEKVIARRAIGEVVSRWVTLQQALAVKMEQVPGGAVGGQRLIAVGPDDRRHADLVDHAVEPVERHDDVRRGRILGELEDHALGPDQVEIVIITRNIGLLSEGVKDGPHTYKSPAYPSRRNAFGRVP